MGTAGEITSLLAALRRGDRQAESNLVELVYDEFHARARKYMRPRATRPYAPANRLSP